MANSLSTLTKLKLITTSDHATRPLLEVLSGWLTSALQRPVSKAKARKLIMAGAVYVNGRRVTVAPHVLSSGIRIEATVDVTKLFDDATSRDKAFELTAERILFEDEDLIFVDKPSGLPAHPTQDKARDSLFSAVRRFLERRDRVSDPYLGLHHRLDRDTSGVLLFTKSKRANAAVAQSFSEHSTLKVYQALTICRSDLNDDWIIRNNLGKVSSKSKRSCYGAVRSGGQFAETSFRVLGRYLQGLWVEAIPKTGRTHQIRVHLAEHGLPILGDDLYGTSESSRRAPRLMLHAVQLVLQHPITQHEVSVRSPQPPDFQECRRNLEKRKLL